MGHSTTELLMQCGRDIEAMFKNSPTGLCEIDEHGWIGLTGEKGTADFNMCAITRTASPELVERYAKTILDRGLNAIMIIDEEAPNLVKAAEDLGLNAVGGVPVMVWENKDIEPSRTHTVRQARDDEHEAVVSLVAQAFSLDEEMAQRAMPKGVFSDNVEAWVVEGNDELAGCGVLVRTGDHVGVYCMATPERNQRKGVGRALLDTSMAQHVASGAKTFTLEATEAGYHLYEQIGYETVATPTVLLIGESTQFPG